MASQPDKLDAYQRAVAALTKQLGKRFVLGEWLGGQHLGARAVESEDGVRGVLKVSDHAYKPVVEQAVRLIEQLRAAGYPAPRSLCHGSLPGGYFYLQERAVGYPMRAGGVWQELNADELAILLGLLTRHSALAPEASHNWSQSVESVTLHRLHEWVVVAESKIPVVQELLQACERCVAGINHSTLRHTDLVIGDFGPHNILVDHAGNVTAVIDLEGAGRGDRVIDLVGLLYMVEPQLLGVVRAAALEIANPAALAVCGVYWIVHRLYLGIKGVECENLQSAAEQMLTYFDLLA